MSARRAPVAVPPEQSRADRVYAQYETVNVAAVRVGLLGSLLAAGGRGIGTEATALAGVWLVELADQIQTGLSALCDAAEAGESDGRA